MKKLVLLAVFCTSIHFTQAQNTFPSSGNVGVGTNSPHVTLEVGGGSTTTGISNVGSTITTRINVANPALSLGFGYVSSDYPMIQTFNNLQSSPANLFLNPFGGNIGIGTINATSSLQIGNYATSSDHAITIPGAYNFEQVRLGQISNGNSAVEFLNHSGVNASYGIKFLVDVDHGAPGLQLQYASTSTTYSGLAYNTSLYMGTDSIVSIGTLTHPAGYKFAVGGNIIAEGITVKVQSYWTDYVFNRSHKLLSLKEVKAYKEKNGHLPEMPSAQEVAKDGLNLAE